MLQKSINDIPNIYIKPADFQNKFIWEAFVMSSVTIGYTETESLLCILRCQNSFLHFVFLTVALR